MAQRDNSFDPAMLDVALRDLPAMRGGKRAPYGDRAAIGACMDGTCDAARTAPYATSLLCNDLDRDFQKTVVIVRALAGQAVATATFNPIDQFFCPVAISMIGRDSTDGITPMPGLIIQASIRGCFQYEWQNPTDTVAGAVGWVDSAALDPTNKSGCACRVNYGCFSNTGNGQANLQLIVGNPRPAGATTTTFTIELWGTAYSCCPGWTNVRDFQRPRDTSGLVPTGAPQPLGNARQRAAAF